MLDCYPQGIVYGGAADAWKTKPVHFEVCWVMQHWQDKGWDADYIFDQAVKWHMSTFNTKSSPMAPEQWPAVVALPQAHRVSIRASEVARADACSRAGR